MDARIAVAVVFCSITLPQLAEAHSRRHHGDGCRSVHGTFSSAPTEPCASPVGMCTLGELRGDIRGAYHFTMAQVLATNEPTIPAVSFFSGASEISTFWGDISGTDAGAIDLNPVGHNAFSTLITLTSGTGYYGGASGYLQIRGQLNLQTGRAKGDYQGKICRP